ncbi:MAG TPA: hypothetical protein VE615_12630 [Gaiellaceae bacterium]|nr:hypothetical protein [Gaiellaceae bacterium]
MNPLKKLLSWLRRPPDPERAAEAQRLQEERDTIKISQTGLPGSAPGAPPIVTPTPDMLDPRRDD